MWIITRCCKKAVQKYIFFLKYQRVTFLKVNINLNFALQFVFPGFFDCFPFIFFISFDVQAGDIFVCVAALNEIDCFFESCHKLLKVFPI